MMNSMFAAVVVLPGIAVLTDIYVDKTSPNCVAADGSQAAPFCTIQQALGVAASGDTIRVAPGTYVENLTWPVRNVELVGTAGAAVTIVDGNGAGSVVVIPVGATATIDGVTLSNGTATVGAGVFSQGTLTLRNSTVSGNLSQAAYYAAGAGVRSQGDLTLINSTISGNTAPASDADAPNDLSGGRELLAALVEHRLELTLDLEREGVPRTLPGAKVDDDVVGERSEISAAHH